MGIFRKLFGKSDKDRPRPEPDVSVALPYETLTVPGDPRRWLAEGDATDVSRADL